ncbi:WD40-repeat-containing domain protein [Blyttiomyces helicus]|uniref:Elongator complex protein 2 n=1 Tax=Blyttiomyces helicus TaxID=388810 RepID=A0A4P9W171_9FUNG|nr:WD40-repeat-containing domain protein [Blyttiomyces helicus]|eukprot:RKO85919.1 WD40-repeat-containing domain protein [Blyttiomyces helicus]
MCVGVGRGRFLPGETQIFASSASDGTARIWERIDGGEGQVDEVKCVQIIDVGPKFPNCLALAYLPNSSGSDLRAPYSSSRSPYPRERWYRQSSYRLRQTKRTGCPPRRPTGGYLRRVASGGLCTVVDNPPEGGRAGATETSGVLGVREDAFTKTLSLHGHFDWVRSVEIATYTATPPNTASGSHFRDGDLVVASGSQDKYIRVWRIADAGAVADAATAGSGPEDLFTSEMMEALAEAGIKRKYTVMFDALLLGHDDWVHCVSWQPAISLELGGARVYHQPMALISASADKSLMIWRPDADSGTWVNERAQHPSTSCSKVRMGEVGGSTLGFYGGHFSPDGKTVIANGYHGAINLWSEASENDPALSLIFFPCLVDWRPRIGATGHFLSVESLAWDPTGQFLVSTRQVSAAICAQLLDQTCRLVAPWNRGGVRTWHEIARPQIHGYDLHCLAFFHKYGFVSGADEKLLPWGCGSRKVYTVLKRTTVSKERANKDRDQAVSAAPLPPSLPSSPSTPRSNKIQARSRPTARIFVSSGENRIAVTADRGVFCFCSLVYDRDWGGSPGGKVSITGEYRMPNRDLATTFFEPSTS